MNCARERACATDNGLLAPEGIISKERPVLTTRKKTLRRPFKAATRRKELLFFVCLF